MRAPLLFAVAVVLPVAVGAAAAQATALPARGATASAAAAPEPPNILLVLTDDQRDGIDFMPAVRKYFVQQGRTYSRAFATTPVCCPSRASIMSGQYAHNHGVQSNVPGVTLDEFVQRETIQRRLDDAGYTTSYLGKFLNGWALEKDPRHFDTYALARVGDNSSNTRYYNTTFAVKDEGESDYHEEAAEGYVTDYLGDEAVSFIESHVAQPWLLILAPTAPHSPFVSESVYRDAWVGKWPGNKAVWEKDKSDKPPYLRASNSGLAKGRQIRALQLRTLMSVDDVIERTMSTLRRTGESDNTLALYVTENGYMWGEHGRIGKDVPYTPAVNVSCLPGGRPTSLRAARTIVSWATSTWRRPCSRPPV
jgi:arylsulfatase A-like enzyme